MAGRVDRKTRYAPTIAFRLERAETPRPVHRNHRPRIRHAGMVRNTHGPSVVAVPPPTPDVRLRSSAHPPIGPLRH